MLILRYIRVAVHVCLRDKGGAKKGNEEYIVGSKMMR